MRRPGGQKPQKDITYLQQNVGKSRPNLVAALAMGAKQGRDVMMFQEPLHHRARVTSLPGQPGYRKYAPGRNWKTAQELPRVVTYVKNSLPSRHLESPVTVETYSLLKSKEPSSLTSTEESPTVQAHGPSSKPPTGRPHRGQ